MIFTGKEGKSISWETAKQWSANFQKRELSISPDTTVIKAHYFGAEKVQQLLNVNDSVGVRVYLGLDDEGNSKLYMTAVSSDMKDILPDNGDGGPIILDDTRTCPPYCP